MKNKKKKDVDTIKRMENWNLIGETPEEETKKKRNSMGQVSIPQQIKMDQAPPKLWTLISLSIFAAKYDQNLGQVNPVCSAIISFFGEAD
ncbi:uncharacterized protein LOC141713022 isoform X7 [Apium graveolens]|uniref:uncharacterized protein LOC141713022 isoform X7 n=1 Tax=Apium graveolens TaxID=4045 RepID=UPI003D7AE861